MDRKSIIQKFEDLKLGKSHGKRAPHKPLLVLYSIGKLLRGESRLLAYSDVDENLGNLLREFGPRKVRYGTHYLFWRLQNDEIWEIPNADNIRQTNSGDALKGDLVRYDVSGGFREDIAHQLQNDSKLVSEIIQKQLEDHFPPSLHEDILQAVEIEFPLQISKRQGPAPNFRANVLKAYQYRCAICGFDVKLGHQLTALEAAHIRWRSEHGPDKVVNGLALCSLHHKLFDLGVFTLSEQLEMLVSDDAHGSVGFQEWLMRFHGKKINFPQSTSYYPQEKFVRWHIREVFKGDYREL